jgi:polar amino acid transport system permease protein
VNFGPILAEWQLYVAGAAVTITAALLGSILAITLSVLLGIASKLGHRGVELFVRGFVYFFRGTPLIVLLFLVFYGLPQVGIVLPAFEAGVLALGFCSAGYMIEVVRASLEAVDEAQSEAAQVDGASSLRTMTQIVFPQAVPHMIANGTNEITALVMATSVLSVIAINDVVLAAQISLGKYFNPFEAYIALAALYLVMTSLITRASITLERWLKTATFGSAT